MHRGLVVGGVLAALIVVPGAPCWIHDLQLARLHWSARRIPLVDPVVDSSAQFGLLWGNSNHCDSQVWVAVDSASPPPRFLATLPPPRLEVWDTTDPARPALVRDDGSLAPLHADRTVEGSEFGLEATDVEALATLARQNPVADGRHLYVLRTVRQSYADVDLLDPRCH